MGFLEKLGFKKTESLQHGVEKSREGILGKLGKAFAGKDRVDDVTLDELEDILITSDVGVKTTVDIINRIEARVARDKYVTQAELQNILREEIIALLQENDVDKPAEFDATLINKPHIVLIVGVNGVGKTTTIGKLSYMYKAAGKNVLLGAADTFRAAAVDQLKIWSASSTSPTKPYSLPVNFRRSSSRASNVSPASILSLLIYPDCNWPTAVSRLLVR